MGCDIHGWVECKVGDKWVAVKPLKDDSRNYMRFSKLAGVRCYDKQNDVVPLGVPNDVSDTTKFYIDYWEGDGHSHSYMPLADAYKIFEETCWYDVKPPDMFYHFFDIDSHNRRYIINNMRLVFWFDD